MVSVKVELEASIIVKRSIHGSEFLVTVCIGVRPCCSRNSNTWI